MRHKKSGVITTHIIELIQRADLIVADLTGHNPNVHYELGVAHALGKQVIPMMMTGDDLPFDNSQMRTIFYSRDHPDDHAAAISELRQRAAALSEPVQNPVTHALGMLKLSQGDDKEQVIATVSTQVASHDAEIAALKKSFGDLVRIVARDYASRPAELPVNALTGKVPQPGGLFGLGLSIPSSPGNALASPGPFADIFDPTKSVQK